MNYKDKAIHYLNSGIILGLLIIAGFMIAFLSTLFFTRIDLTEAKQFSISPTTQSALESLKDPVNIRVYFSKKLPPEFLKTNQYVKDILSEYQAYSKNNIHIRYLDPGNPDIAEEARSYGIPQLQMNVYTKDRFEIQAGFMGLAVIYEDHFETLPVIDHTANLEYDLTSAIKKVTSPEIKVIGFLTGHGENSITGQDSNYQKIQEALRKNYQIKTVDLDADNPLKKVDTLIIAGPKENFSDEHLLAIDQFMIHGGKVLFLIDKIDISPQLTASVSENNLDDFLSKLGVIPESQLVVDQSNETASFSQGYTTFIVPYPFWIKLIPDNFTLDIPIMNQLSSLVIPWGSPLTLQTVEGLKAVTLAKTTPHSGIQKDPFNLNPGAKILDMENKPSIPMAVMVNGTYSSYFKDKKIKKGTDFMDNSSVPIQSIIVGSSRFIEDNYLKRFPQNLNFFMNSIDYLTLDNSLMSIRAKTVRDRSIGEISDNMKELIKFFSIYFVPILIIVIGIIRAYWLRKMKKLRLV